LILISLHYSSEDVAEIMNGKLKFNFDLFKHDPDELAAFERYRKSMLKRLQESLCKTGLCC